MRKITDSAGAAVAGITDGCSIAIGGFGLCGTPSALVGALLQSGAADLHIITNNCGPGSSDVTRLLREGRVNRVTASYIGDNPEFLDRYLSGAIRVDLVPQGTLAEKLRSGGAGIPAFYTPTGAGTAVAQGGIPARYADGGGRAAEYSAPRRVAEFDGREYLLEHSLTADFALVRAETADSLGNLRFRGAAGNFNPLCAMAARVAIAEVRSVVEAGGIAPDDVHLPGVFISRIVNLGGHMKKPIERLKTAVPVPGAGEEGLPL
jgi:3-oxoacid CoA-transferase subunit A